MVLRRFTPGPPPTCVKLHKHSGRRQPTDFVITGDRYLLTALFCHHSSESMFAVDLDCFARLSLGWRYSSPPPSCAVVVNEALLLHVPQPGTMWSQQKDHSKKLKVCAKSPVKSCVWYLRRGFKGDIWSLAGVFKVAFEVLQGFKCHLENPFSDTTCGVSGHLPPVVSKWGGVVSSQAKAINSHQLMVHGERYAAFKIAQTQKLQVNTARYHVFYTLKTTSYYVFVHTSL